MTPHVSIKLLLTQSDDRLVRMAAAGHDRAFEAIVDRYRRQLLRYAERFPAAGPAEDVVQAAFVRAWGSLRGGTDVRDLRPWLYRIVHNTAINAAKRQHGVATELIESEALGVGPEAETELQDELRRTLDGIAALPDRQRDALVAVAVDGRAHADVGRELGITEPAVRQLVRRARASVRAVASALTPYPLITWIAEAGATQAPTVARIGEVVGGAGTGAIALKLGAVAATTGALVVGAPTVHHSLKPHRIATAAAVTPRTQDDAGAAQGSGGAADAGGERSPSGTTRSGMQRSRGAGERRHGRGRGPHGGPAGPLGGIETLRRDDRGHEVHGHGDAPEGTSRHDGHHGSREDGSRSGGESHDGAPDTPDEPRSTIAGNDDRGSDSGSGSSGSGSHHDGAAEPVEPPEGPEPPEPVEPPEPPEPHDGATGPAGA